MGRYLNPDACVYLVSGVNFALIDSDCVSVTLYEIQELWCSCGNLDHASAPAVPAHTPTSFEALRGSPRPARGQASDAKTYWHEDKARLTGTRIYIILLLESHGNGDGVAVGNCGAL